MARDPLARLDHGDARALDLAGEGLRACVLGGGAHPRVPHLAVVVGQDRLGLHGSRLQ